MDVDHTRTILTHLLDQCTQCSDLYDGAGDMCPACVEDLAAVSADV